MSKIINLPPMIIDMTVGKHVLSNINLFELLVVDVNNGGDLNQHLDQCSGYFAYFAAVEAEAINSEAVLANDMKVWMAQRKREAMNKTGIKFTSEVAKEDAVVLENLDEYARRNKEILEAKYKCSILKAITDSFKVKKDMLISLSSNLRQEMSTGISINKWNDQFKR